MNAPLTQQRIRIRFRKEGPVRLIGHLDMAKTWERVLRRAALPVEYSQGFNPRPRMQFAAALPVGVTSESEYLDVWLTRRLDEPLDAWIARLAETSPSGLAVESIEEVPVKQAALPTLVSHSEFVITPLEGVIAPEELRQRAQALLDAPRLDRMRNQKPYDLRPLILDLTVDSDGRLIAQVLSGEQTNARPDELLGALGLDLTQARVHRRRLFLRSE